ncbi:MAG TPA: DUF4157 domain-containing protein [Mucilaginibacter sp.]|jgi:hypothetical protein|nr:DUF4157 domain-containing protein [Mucilaginibacter sp.]
MYTAKENIKNNAGAGCANGGRPFFQAKLTVNQPGDAYEQEADAMADKVMRMTDSSFNQNVFFKPAINHVNRKCRECEEEETKLNRKENAEGGVEGSNELDNYVGSLRSAGQPMPERSRMFFEPRFGHDFSNVRLHTDSVAAKSAQSINALAYTAGNSIVFNQGQYSPETQSGQRLMAHELTHVVQQKGANNHNIQRKIEVPAGTELDTLEIKSTKSGNTYTCPSVVKTSTFYEIYTSMLVSPRIFKLAGKTNEEIFQNLKKHIDARNGIIVFASKKKYTFGAGGQFKMNPKYFVWNDKTWDYKPGVDKQEARNDLNVHPEQYNIACAAATKLTMVGGSNSDLIEGQSQDLADWVPGDWGYIENLNFTKNRVPGLEGENIIYVGKDQFWGHYGEGNTYDTLPGWEKQVKGFENGNGQPEIEDQRTYPSIGLKTN